MILKHISMRNLTLLILVFTCALNTYHGQTLTSDWFLQAGDGFSIESAFNPEEIIVPTEGIDQEWDFSNAVTEDSAIQEYVKPTEMTRADTFSRATMAIGLPGLLEIFYNNEGDTLDNLGLFIGLQGELFVIYDDNQGELLAVSPMSFGDVFDHSVGGTIALDGMIFPAAPVTQRFSFAGMGTVITPARRTTDCIYLKTEILDNDGNAATTIHSFYRDHMRNLIAQFVEQLDANTGLPDPSFNWQTDFSGNATENIASLDLRISNNLSSHINIHSSIQIDAKIQLINPNGQSICVKGLSINPGDNFIDFSDELTYEGQYILYVVDKNSGSFLIEKITFAQR